jgi:hypothetical protein
VTVAIRSAIAADPRVPEFRFARSVIVTVNLLPRPLARVTRSRFALLPGAVAASCAFRRQQDWKGHSFEPEQAATNRASRGRRGATIREKRDKATEWRHLHRPRTRVLSWLGRPNRSPPSPVFPDPEIRDQPEQREETAD